MPSDDDIYKEITANILNKTSQTPLTIEMLNGLTYDNIMAGVKIKLPDCDENRFEEIFIKMKKNGEIIKKESNFSFYHLNKKPIKFGEEINPPILAWLIGSYLLLFGFIVILNNTFKATQESIIILFILGTLSVHAGNLFLKFLDKLNSWILSLGKKHSCVIRIFIYSIAILIFMATIFFLASILFSVTIELSSVLIIMAIAASIASSTGIVTHLDKKSTKI